MSAPTGEAREGRVVTAIPQDTYAHRLMLARAHAGHLSIREAAARCGLNHASWANWEKGTASRTQVDDVDAIAEALEIDREWLLRGGPLAATTRRPKREVRSPYPRTVRPGQHLRRPRRLDRLDRIPA